MKNTYIKLFKKTVESEFSFLGEDFDTNREDMLEGYFQISYLHRKRDLQLALNYEYSEDCISLNFGAEDTKQSFFVFMGLANKDEYYALGSSVAKNEEEIIELVAKYSGLFQKYGEDIILDVKGVERKMENTSEVMSKMPAPYFQQSKGDFIVSKFVYDDS